MEKRTALAASVLALLVASPVFAQGALVGVESLDDRIDDIQEGVDDDFARSQDDQRFGTSQFTQGWSGSLSASLAATSGNTDTADFSLGSRLRYGAGPWNHSLGLAFEYGEDNGVRSKEEAFATYEVNRYFNESVYGFGLGSVRYDDFASNRFDAFLGFGPGFRVINEPNVTWRIQAGPGVRYIEDQDGDTSTELAGLASSRVFYQVTDSVFITNDTDALYSDDSWLLTNEFGVNFKVTDTLTTRLGYLTEYNSDPLPGLDDFDNKLTAAIVVGF
ncbi:MAG: DUF481 domain-containing protein [Pseudomonadota bacterium]